MHEDKTYSVFIENKHHLNNSKCEDNDNKVHLIPDILTFQNTMHDNCVKRKMLNNEFNKIVGLNTETQTMKCQKLKTENPTSPSNCRLNRICQCRGHILNGGVSLKSTWSHLDPKDCLQNRRPCTCNLQSHLEHHLSSDNIYNGSTLEDLEEAVPPRVERSRTPTGLDMQLQKSKLLHLPSWDIVNHSDNRRTRSLYGASQNCKFGPKASIMKSQAAVLTIQDPRSQRLTWYKPPLSVLVIKKIFDAEVIKPYTELISWLIQEKKMVVFVESKSHEELLEHPTYRKVKSRLCTFKEGEDDLTDKIDFIICIGGDGTLLYASSLFQQSVPPIMSFFWGSLGFLTPFSFDTFREDITQVLEGNAGLVLRTRLKGVVCKSGGCPEQPENVSIRDVESKQHILVLNEVVVDRGPNPYLTNIDLYIEHRYVTSVQGDGLIIATPTGSTAYAAAAGASMVHPNVPAIVITPVCPHSLSFRPIIVPAGVEIKICVSPESRTSAYVSFDGRHRLEITKGDSVRISTSIYPVPSICHQDQISDWFDTLVGCLHWNQRKPQKSFSNSSTSQKESSVLSDESNSLNHSSRSHSSLSPDSSDNGVYSNGVVN